MLLLPPELFLLPPCEGLGVFFENMEETASANEDKKDVVVDEEYLDTALLEEAEADTGSMIAPRIRMSASIPATRLTLVFIKSSSLSPILDKVWFFIKNKPKRPICK